MNTFVVPLKIVEPDGAAGRQLQRTCFIRHTLPFSRNDEAKAGAVVEDADFKYIVRFRRRVFDGDPSAVAIVDRPGMDTARRVVLTNLKAFDLAEGHLAAYVSALEPERQCR